METDTYNLISAFLQTITAIGAGVIGWKQYQINRRMQDLSDYVAVSMVPAPQGFEIMNVGRSNLYLHKWEVGVLRESFVKPLLLPTEARSKINITMQLQQQSGRHLAKFYLTDERNVKYLSTGEIAVEPVSFQLPAVTTPSVELQPNFGQEQTSISPVVQIQLRIRAWSYKTVKHNWSL